MIFSDLLYKRQSVRKYLNRVVEKEKIMQIVEAVRLAPSACNSQPWTLIMVDEPDLKGKVARATFSSAVAFNRFTLEAPVIAVLVMEKPKLITQIGGRIKNQEYPYYDIGIAAEHFCLQATELGLGTCVLGWFDEKKIMELLQIPKSKKIGLLITLGYAPDDYKVRKKIRKSLDEMCKFNSYDS